MDNSLVETHEMWAGRLEIVVLAPRPAPISGLMGAASLNVVVGRNAKVARIPVRVKPLIVLLPLSAISVIVLAYLTGEAGAVAVWSETE